MEHEALALQDKGEYKAAEELFRNCLSERQRALGADHIDTLAAMNNLANLLHDRGENLEAETLHQQVLEARECLRGRVPLSRIARGSRNFTGWESSRNLARALRVFSASEKPARGHCSATPRLPIDCGRTPDACAKSPRSCEISATAGFASIALRLV